MRRFALSALLFSLALALAGCNGMYGGSSGGNSPSITGVSPSNGPVGTSVTISGKNFGSTQGYSTVSFNGTAATPTSWSATTIIAPVPTGAATGNVVVTVGSIASNGMTFTVTSAAPTITTQPANQTVKAGQTATFTVTATGTAPLSYQWQKNGANISGATSASYTTPTTTTSDSGSTFVVAVSNSAGTATSNAATLTVNPAPVAPTITTQPANQTVTAGQTATFSVTATGTAPLSYQWQKNGANISGATSASYTTPATTTSDSGSTFRVIVSNTAGTATSNSATLAVTSTAPSITSLNPTSGPVGTSVAITGTNFGATQGTSTVTFNGATAAPTGWSATSITAQVPTGATSGNVVVTVGGVASNGATFTVTTGSTAFPIKASANGRYFTDANGVPWIMVADAAHHMIPAIAATSVQAYLNDRVQNGFNSINLFFMCANAGTCPASGAAFDGTLPFLTGTGPSSYDLSTPNGTYWSKVDAIITAASNLGLVVFANPIPWGTSGQNFSTTIQNNGATKDFNFGVFIGNRYKNFPNIIWSVGQDWSSWNSSASDLNDEAQLMAGIRSADPNHLMMVQLSFQQYSNQAIAQGNATYNANLTSDFAYTYHEAYDTVLNAYNNATVLPVVMGESNYETGNNLGLLSSAANAFITRQEMWYTMTSGATGHVWGNEHVNHFDSSYLSNLDTTATTQVKYLTNLFNQYQWWTFAPDQSHAVVTAGYGTYNGANGNMYNATYATTTWDGSSAAITYMPVATTLTVNMAKFSKAVTAFWYDPTTGTSTTIGSFPNSGTQTFTTPGTSHNDGTHDWVLVLDPPANGTPLAPAVTTQPANQTVTAGQTATFSVVATGTAPLSYQWQKNSANISGATSSTYTTPATTASDNGSTFRVVVSNSAGTATSNAATLTVNPAPAPAIQVNPTSISFGNVVVGSNLSQSLIISNTGNATLTITQINVTGLTFGASGYTLPLSVNAGQQTTITMAFLPTAVGSVSGSVSLVSNAPTSPTSVGLSGSGIAATLTLGINPTSLSFGNVVTGTTSATQNVTITNAGNSNVTISQITVTGAGYTMTGGTTPVTLTPSQNLVLGVQFSPASAGSVAGSISITSNATGSPATVTLSGTGVVPHTVSLSWTASTSTVSGYNVYRSTTSGSGYVKINTSLVSTVTYTDANVTSGTTYYYVTTAVDSGGNESGFSNQATAVIP